MMFIFSLPLGLLLFFYHFATEIVSFADRFACHCNSLRTILHITVRFDYT